MRRAQRKSQAAAPPRPAFSQSPSRSQPQARLPESPPKDVKSAVNTVHGRLKKIMDRVLEYTGVDGHSPHNPALTDLLDTCARLELDLKSALIIAPQVVSPPSGDRLPSVQYTNLSHILAETQTDLFAFIKANPSLDALKLKGGIWEAFSSLSSRLFQEFVLNRKQESGQGNVEMMEKLKELELENEEMKKINEEMMKDLTDSQLESRKLMEFVSKLHEDKVGINKKLAEAHTQVEYFKHKLKNSADAQLEVVSRNEELKKLNENVMRQMKELNGHYEALKRDLTVLETDSGRTAEWEEELTTLKSEKEGLLLKMEVAQTQMERRNKALGDEMAALKLHVADLETVNEELEANAQNQDSELSEKLTFLSASLSTKEAELRSAIESNQQKDGFREDLESEIKRLKQNLSESQVEIAHLTSEIQSLKEKSRTSFANSQSETQLLKQEIQNFGRLSSSGDLGKERELEQANLHLQRQVTYLQRTNKELVASLQSAVDKSAQLQAEKTLHFSQGSVDSVETSDAVFQRKSVRRRTIQELADKINALEEKLTMVQDEKAALQLLMDSKPEEDVEIWRVSVDKMKAENAELAEQVKNLQIRLGDSGKEREIRAELSKVMTNKSKLEGEVDAYRIENQGIQRKLKEMQENEKNEAAEHAKTVQNLEEILRENLRIVETISGQLATAQETYETALKTHKSEVDKLTSQLQSLDFEVSELNTRLNTSFEEAKYAKNQLQTALTELSDEKHARETAETLANQRIKSLKNDLSLIEDERNKDISDSSRKRAVLEEKIGLLNEEIREKEEKIEEIEEEIRLRDQEIDRLKREKSDLTSVKVSENDSAQHDLKQQLIAKDRDIRELTAQLSASRDRTKEKETDFASQMKALNEETQVLKDSYNALNRLHQDSKLTFETQFKALKIASDQYQEEITEKGTEISHLKTDLAKAVQNLAEFDQMKSTVFLLTDENERLKQSLAEAGVRIKEAESATENLIDQLEDEKSRYRKLQEKQTKLESDLKRNFVRLTELEDENAFFLQNQSEKPAEISAETVQNLEIQNQDLETRLLALSKELEFSRKAAESIERESDKKGKEALALADQLYKAVEVAEAEKLSYKDKAEASDRLIMSLDAQIRTLTEELRGKNESGKERESTENAKSRFLEGRISHLEKELASFTEEKVSLEAEIAAARDKVASLEAAVTTARDQVASLTTALQESDDALTHTKEDFRLTLDDNEKLQQMCAILQDSVSAKTGQNEALETQLADLLTELTSLKSENANFHERKSGDSDENKEAKIVELETERLELVRKIEDLEIELDGQRFERQDEEALQDSNKLGSVVNMSKQHVNLMDLLEFRDADSPLVEVEESNKGTPSSAPLKVCKRVSYNAQIWCLLADLSEEPDYVWMRQEEVDPELKLPSILDEDFDYFRLEMDSRIDSLESELEEKRGMLERAIGILREIQPSEDEPDLDAFLDSFLYRFSREIQPEKEEGKSVFSFVEIGSPEQRESIQGPNASYLSPDEAQSLITTIKRLEAENEQLEQTLQLQEQQLKLLHTENQAKTRVSIDGETVQSVESHIIEAFANFAKTLPQL